MRRAGSVFACLIALLIGSPQVRADDDGNPGGVGIGLTVGTVGVGGEVSVRPIGNFVLRLGGTWFAFDHDFNVDNVTYGLKTNFISAGATIDWHPFGNGIRLSAGGRYHSVDFTGKGSAIGTFDLNGHSYTIATTGPLSANVTWPGAVAPYLGIGFDSTHFSDSRWALALDLGVIHAGEPTSKLTALNATPGSQLATDLLIAQKDLGDSVSKYGQFWPVVTLALKYRF
jgi:hypothetical protein